ncbi:hypothetical protein CMU71_13750 [Elizabethkingia anophelis]|uniref:hypothetical protein n=1 Tax=Elizabethkingia anophelis TaxID=1117645 RepID=UPI001F4AD0B5|nr:hypothetical protein [Elizabethkingia anophelis]MDV3567964.1 hypothetical protein [Elizabethkingia anophelis]MDV3969598.1 hypothetical protein [Elizabethkingia anophelis]
MFKYKINFIAILLFLLGLSSCSNNRKIVDEDFINLYPNKQVIKKQYYNYSTLDPFSPTDSLYSPIPPSKSNINRGKGLIVNYKSYDLQYFYKYIKKEMGGTYTSYIYSKDIPVFRYYLKFYKKEELKKFDTNKKIEAYFKQKNIDYEFVKNKPNKISIYILKNKNAKPIYCTIISDEDWENIYLTYNIKDTIKDLSSQSFRPFLASKIED